MRAFSLDHLVGELLEVQGHFETERSGSFEVNSEYEFCREFDRQVAWLRALQDLVDIGSSAAIILARIDPVACKPSNLDILGVGHNRRQASGKCELNDTGALGLEQPVRRYNDGLRPLLGQIVECGSEINGRTGFLYQQRDTASAGGGLNLLHPQRHRRARRIGKEANPR